MAKTLQDKIFEAIAIDDEGRACQDIPDEVYREEAGNFFTHVGALALSKSADGLVDPKLVLSWLLTTLGAPAAMLGLLVPIREAGALLPQLFTAGGLRRLPRRKWAWTAGAIGQGVAALAMAWAAISLDGAAAGYAILTALTVFALSRSVCSVSYKDVLGKTVDKSRRGRATGLAGSVAAGGTILFALVLASGLVDRMSVVRVALALAGLFWIASALMFSTLTEKKGATEGGKAALVAAIENLGYLKSSKQLRRFIAARGLLTATALAPPFMVAAGSATDEAYGSLGLLVLASAGAALLSSFVWGRLADHSSRKVLIFAASGGALALALTVWAGMAGRLETPLVLPVLLFTLMIAYQGVRLGRSTHLVDMADTETRAPFTALSNTIIGVFLFAGVGFGWFASAFGNLAVLGFMAGMCLLAIPVALGLQEVQQG